MGAFVLKIRPTTDTEPRDKSRASFSAAVKGIERQGFAPPVCCNSGRFDIALFGKRCGGEPVIYENSNGDFCAIAGTLILNGKSGLEAAKAILQEFNGSPIRREHALGTFCVVLLKYGRLSVWTDANGTYKVYHDTGLSLVSSSFLALLEAGASRKLERQEVYEYVFQGATYGTKTPCQDVYMLGADAVISCGAGQPKVRESREDLVAVAEKDVLSNKTVSVDEVADILRSLFAEIIGVFTGGIDTALSGGYDSRLMLAILLAAGEKPRVHVYGAPYSSDVKVATSIGSKLGIKVDHVDKNNLARRGSENEAFQVVKDNFYAFDGLPIDGIFDFGADLVSRTHRASGGRVALNGGGGEIFRNFFYLPDRPFTIRQLLHSFYTQLDPSWCTSLFDESEFHDSLHSKIEATLRFKGDKLTRRQIELLYPVFRCRYWMGRNNSLNNRFGHAMTPFVEPRLVLAALRIPLRLKNYGTFESELINSFSPELAAIDSSYGYNFRESPSSRRKIESAINRSKPIMARRFAYRIKNRIHGRQLPSCLDQGLLSNVIDTSFPVMSTYFRVSRVKDPAVLARIGSIEYLARVYDLSGR